MWLLHWPVGGRSGFRGVDLTAVTFGDFGE